MTIFVRGVYCLPAPNDCLVGANYGLVGSNDCLALCKQWAFERRAGFLDLLAAFRARFFVVRL